MNRLYLLPLLLMLLLAMGSTSEEGGEEEVGDVDALGGSSTTYTFTCPSGTQSSVPVSAGPCQSAQENYAYTFGCNEADDFRSACESYYSCAVNNSTGEYRAYYQQHLDYCSSYGSSEGDETVLLITGKSTTD